MVDLAIIISELTHMRHIATAEFSGFKVGCVLEDIFGRYHCGANSEYEDRTAGLCAESAAIAAMSSSVGATKIKAIYLCGAPQDDKEYNKPTLPCGLCRQRLAEISDENTEFISLSPKGEVLYQCKFFELFPQPFTVNLNEEFIEFINTKRRAFSFKNGTDINAALQKLYDRSFPLSGKREACIIELKSGDIIGGNYFGTSCYKADIDAKTAVYSQIARQNLWAEIRKVHTL